MNRKSHTSNELRTLARQTGPQWEGEARAALVYCADVIDSANAAVADAQSAIAAAVQAEREACADLIAAQATQPLSSLFATRAVCLAIAGLVRARGAASR